MYRIKQILEMVLFIGIIVISFAGMLFVAVGMNDFRAGIESYLNSGLGLF